MYHCSLGVFTSATWAVEVSVLFGVHVSLVSSEGVEDAVVVHSASAWQGDGEFWLDDCPRLPGSVFSGYSLSGSCLPRCEAAVIDLAIRAHVRRSCCTFHARRFLFFSLLVRAVKFDCECRLRWGSVLPGWFVGACLQLSLYFSVVFD